MEVAEVEVVAVAAVALLTWGEKGFSLISLWPRVSRTTIEEMTNSLLRIGQNFFERLLWEGGDV